MSVSVARLGYNVKKDFSMLSEATQIEAIGIRGDNLTTDDIRPLGSLLNLKSIKILEGPQIDDEVFKVFKDCKNLESVIIRGTSVTGTGLEHLSKSREKIKTMEFSGSQISDAIIDEIIKFPNLKKSRFRLARKLAMRA